jgi:hypothetical protein
MFEIIQVIGDLKNFFGSKDPEIVKIKEEIKGNEIRVLFSAEKFLAKATLPVNSEYKRRWVSGNGSDALVPVFNPKKIQVILITHPTQEFQFLMYLPLSNFV